MRKIVLIIFLFVVVGLSSFGIIRSQTRSPQSTNTIRVSASIYPLYYFAKEIGGNRATVSLITPAGVEPHDYEPTPNDIATIYKSKLLVVNGAGFEPWFEHVREDVQKNNVTIVESSHFISLIESSDSGSVTDDATHTDPHTWLSPEIVGAQMRAIEAGFFDVDPEHKSYYVQNSDALMKNITTLQEEYSQGLAHCKTRSFVTSHAAFGYLARDYRLTQTPIQGLSPDGEPSAARLAEIATFVKEHQIKYIFFEKLVSPKLSEVIAQETGAQTLVLDPLEGLTKDEIQSGKDYFSVMRENLANLRTALACT